MLVLTETEEQSYSTVCILVITFINLGGLSLLILCKRFGLVSEFRSYLVLRNKQTGNFVSAIKSFSLFTNVFNVLIENWNLIGNIFRVA